MSDHREFEMTQADYDQIIERISDARKTSGMFLSGGRPMSDPQEAANYAWAELGQRMGFKAMTVQPGRSKLHFTAEPAPTSTEKAK